MIKRTVAAAFCFFTHSLFAADKIDIPYIAKSAVIDGVLDEPHWQQAYPIKVDNVTWPYENIPSDEKMDVLVYENGEMLYIAYQAFDSSPEHIRAFYRDRDRAWDDDLVGLKIDSFNNQKLAYQFFINPLGVQMDSIENELTKQESDAWDGIWESAGQINEQGYIVEVAIPFRMLNFDDSVKTKQMAMEFVRFIPRNERLRVSSIKIDHNNNCWICQMHTVTGFEQTQQGNNLTIVPALVMGKSQQRDISSAHPDWQDDSTIEPSLDVKWGITPDVTLNTTINPDFSQVEADVAQLSINDNFALFYPEKRAFFADNADYFTSPWDLIYTRNVAEPDFGAKVTGNVGQHNFAAFVANDQQSNIIIPGNLGSTIVSLDNKSKNAAGRYRYDFSNDFSIAATTTARESDDYHNYMVSLDTKYRFTDSDTFVFQYAQSDTQYSDEFVDNLCGSQSCDNPDETECEIGSDCAYSEPLLRVLSDTPLKDNAYRISYEHNEKHWMAFSNYSNIGDEFRADLGFMGQVDFNKFVTGGRYRWYGDDKTWWNRMEFYSDWDISHNDNQELLEKELQASFSINGPLQSYVQLELMQRQRTGLRHDKSSLVIDGNTTLFDEDLVALYAEIKPMAGLFMSMNLSSGDQIDLSNNRIGERVRIRPVVNFNLTRHLELKLRHTYEKMNAANADLFTANLTDARITYQFDIKSFLRLAFIYTDIDRNADNYLKPVNEQYQSFSTQLLYSYKVNPQTVFFAGYSDNGYQDDDIERLKRAERAIFLKLSYAWLL
ncbi:hypothetical protein PULV_a3514 [Pseudoalteromonas ulvae UL12]|uniref:carbohydrate binding family 9 domain-containing protein n=1 Tax=Pseudoalteromonas ulvae TaxID=107327 RepID=UPI00186BA597|nr:carbohydrate binding family 9 domain-containing protein [Pseudoalteromonas ulvae]MBE0363326.1 hypothetical protein [Pseudoalteromonas ulvae UL12]